jgi:hypothetical protein
MPNMVDGHHFVFHVNPIDYPHSPTRKWWHVLMDTFGIKYGVPGIPGGIPVKTPMG